jgi:hypothetical protein
VLCGFQIRVVFSRAVHHLNPKQTQMQLGEENQSHSSIHF